MDELQEHVHTSESLGATCYANISRAFQLGHAVVQFLEKARSVRFWSDTHKT